jgi:hypothetical protein
VTAPRDKSRGFICPEVPELKSFPEMLVEAVDF